MKTICSFDPGVKNLSFLIEEYNMEILKNLKCPSKTKRFVKKDVDPQATPKKKKKRGEDKEPSPEYNDFLEEFYHTSHTIFYKNTNISCGEKITSNKSLTQEIFIELTKVLDAHKNYFDKCDEIVIEEQMSFGKRLNLTAIKIAQHIYSYFAITYGSAKKIVIMPAYNKTELLGCPGGLAKPQRKKWAIEKAKEIWTYRGDLDNLENLLKHKKLDDISDNLCINLAYMIIENFSV
jgi:hypothetical protein